MQGAFNGLISIEEPFDIEDLIFIQEKIKDFQIFQVKDPVELRKVKTDNSQECH